MTIGILAYFWQLAVGLGAGTVAALKQILRFDTARCGDRARAQANRKCQKICEKCRSSSNREDAAR